MPLHTGAMGRRNRPFDATKVYCPRRGATQSSDAVNFSPLLKLRLDSAEVPVVFPGAELTGQIVLLRDMHQDLERLEMTLTGRAIAKWWADDQCYFGREKFIKEKFVVWETERSAFLSLLLVFRRIPLFPERPIMFWI